jgi:hypothetical protein
MLPFVPVMEYCPAERLTTVLPDAILRILAVRTGCLLSLSVTTPTITAFCPVAWLVPKTAAVLSRKRKKFLAAECSIEVFDLAL